MRGEDEVDALVLERLEHLRGGLAERHEALERLLDVGLGGGGALVGEVPVLELAVPAAVRQLHFLRQVGEVEHVQDGARHQDGVGGGQPRQLGSQLPQLGRVFLALVVGRHLVALLDLHASHLGIYIYIVSTGFETYRL